MSAPDANGWMPIETAPKDGTQIIFYVPAMCGEIWGPIPPQYALVSWDRGGWCRAPGSSWTASGMPSDTVWQPLPKPPVTTC